MIVPVITKNGSPQSTSNTTNTNNSRIIPVITKSQPITQQKPVAPVKNQPIPPVIKITPNQTNIFQNAQKELQKVVKVGTDTVLSFVKPKQQVKSPIPKDQVINKNVTQQQPQATPILKIAPDQKKLTPMQLEQVQPASAQMRVTPQSIEAQKQTVAKGTKFITDVKNTQTFKTMEDLKIDPLQFKANPKKAVDGFLTTVKDALTEEKKRINDFIKVYQNLKSSDSEKLGAKINLVSGTANVVFSPLTGLFKAAEEIPVLATLSKVISLPFTAAGELSTEVSNKVVDALPISTKAKNDIKAPLGEMVALASQLIIGKVAEIKPGKRTELVNKYGIEDANTIIKKARELAKDKMGRTRMNTVLPDGEYTPQQVMGKVIANGLENTSEGRTLVKTAVEAQQRGESVQVKNTPETIQTFEQNIQDYRSFGGYTVGTSVENAALRDIAGLSTKPEIIKHTQEKVKTAIESGEVKTNSDGTITLYRGGNPSTKNGLSSATYDKTIAQRFADNAGGVLHEFKVKPEDIQAFIGKAEKEVLVKNEKVRQNGANAGLSDVYKGKEFTFMRNTEKSPKMGNRFGQNIEPAGKYMTLADEGQTYFPPGFETGKVKFDNPLVVDWGEGYQSGKNWKNVLSQKYGGKKGKALSEAIAKDGYDGIITLDNGKPSEVVSLIDFRVAQQSTPNAGLYDATDISPMGRIKTASIDKVYAKIPDGTVSPDGMIIKRGDKLFPTTKATPEILKNSGVELNPDGSIKEGFVLNRIGFTEDVALNKPNVAQQSVSDVKPNEVVTRYFDKNGKEITGKKEQRVLNTKEVQAVKKSIGDRLEAIGEKSTSEKDMQDGYTQLYNDIVRESNNDKVVLSALRTSLRQEMNNLVGVGDSKLDYATLQTFINSDSPMAPVLSKLEDLVISLDKKLLSAQEPARVVPLAPEKVKVVERNKPLETVGTGETVKSKFAGRIEQTAVEQGLADTFGQLPEYQKTSMKEQASLAIDLIKSDFQKAVQVALGNEIPPKGLLPEIVLKVVKDYAVKNQDVSLIRQLATESNLSRQLTAMGQRIRAAGEFDKSNPVDILQDIVDNRRQRIEEMMKTSVKEATEKTVKEIKTRVKAPDKYDWSTFLDSIQC